MPFSSPQDLRGLIADIADAVIAAADELTELDRDIGDGDHGLNMKRGFEAVKKELDRICAGPPGEAVKAVGTTLVMNVGGASGPLYGSLFMTMGKTLGAVETPDLAAIVDAFAQGVEAVGKRGKSETGQKTMLDVLVPVAELLRREGAACLPGLAEFAHARADATIPMKATRGRASFLGDRSIGHMDPGARSSALMIEVACRGLGAES